MTGLVVCWLSEVTLTGKGTVVRFVEKGTEVMKVKSCEIPESTMLPNPVHLNVDDCDLDFSKAEMIAKDQAKSYHSGAMLLSWYDRKLGRYSPHDVECCAEGKPSWVSYAKSRGGNLTIDINNEEYVFVFRGKQGLS